MTEHDTGIDFKQAAIVAVVASLLVAMGYYAGLHDGDRVGPEGESCRELLVRCHDVVKDYDEMLTECEVKR